MNLKEILRELAYQKCTLRINYDHTIELFNNYNDGTCISIKKFYENGDVEEYIFPYGMSFIRSDNKLEVDTVSINANSAYVSFYNDATENFKRGYKIYNLIPKNASFFESANKIYFNKSDSNIKNEFDIKKVIFNPPATIVIFNDGTKTVVKCHDETFDQEKGLLMCIIKHQLGNKSNFNNVINRYIENAEGSKLDEIKLYADDKRKPYATLKPSKKKRGKKNG